MSEALRIRAVEMRRLAIPMRVAFEHAQATRSTADPLVLRLSAGAPFHELAGCGETLARPYVTGESPETVLDDLERVFLPALLDFHPRSFPEALEFIDVLPFERDGRRLNAARAAIELALLDLAGQAFQRRASDVAGWAGLGGFGAPGALRRARYSGIILGGGAKARWLVWLQRRYGLRDFKLKVAVPDWPARLENAARALRGAIRAGRATLRVDANAGWTPQEAVAAIPQLEAAGVCAIEQPLRPAHDEELTQLATRTRCDLIADESLVSQADAAQLLESGGVQVFNLRIAKVGGLIPALRIAHMALAAGRDVQLGCLVGETSILTAAGLAFLEACPRVRFVEGAYGSFLLRRDIVRRPLRFGYGGRLSTPSGTGLGVEIDPAALERVTSGQTAYRL